MRILPENIQTIILRKQNRGSLFYCGIQLDRLRLILTERARPTAREVHAIAQALGVNVSEIAAGDPPPPASATR